MICRTAPFSMILKDPYPRFQGHAILWRWVSQQRYEIQTYFQWNTNRVLYTFYSTVSFRMTLSDFEWLSKIFNDTLRCAVSLRQLNLFCIRTSRTHSSSVMQLSCSNWDDESRKQWRLTGTQHDVTYSTGLQRTCALMKLHILYSFFSITNVFINCLLLNLLIDFLAGCHSVCWCKYKYRYSL